MGLWPNWYQPGNKACHVSKISEFYVEKGRNLHLACKSLFHKPEYNAKREARRFSIYLKCILKMLKNCG